MNEIVDYCERNWIWCVLILILAIIAFIYVILDESQIVNKIVMNILKK